MPDSATTGRPAQPGGAAAPECSAQKRSRPSGDHNTAQQKDVANCKDHAVLTRIPDYWIPACTLKQFDSYAFMSGKNKTTPVEGQFTLIRYQPPASLKTKPSTLQLLRNVENAVKQIGGTLMATDQSKEVLKLTKDGKEIWIEVWADYASNSGYGVRADGTIMAWGIYVGGPKEWALAPIPFFKVKL